jgi:hypothetical protein
MLVALYRRLKFEDEKSVSANITLNQSADERGPRRSGPRSTPAANRLDLAEIGCCGPF